MKNGFSLLSLCLLITCSLSANINKEDSNIERLKRNPGIYLNFQDVPFFYTGNPLEGLDTFAVIPPYSIQSPEANQEIITIIEAELGRIGAVIKAKSEDMEGFGARNILNIQIGRVSKWNGGDLSISRVTLSVETSVVISKTNVKSLPRVWTINDFVDVLLNLNRNLRLLELSKNFSENLSKIIDLQMLDKIKNQLFTSINFK